MNPPQNFQRTTPQTRQTSTPDLSSVAPLQTHNLPIESATISSPPSPVILSSSACFYNDHYAGIGSPSTEVHASRSTTIEQTGSVTGSPLSAVQSGPSIGSPTDLQLCVDLSSYPLQHLTDTSSSSP